MANVSIVDDLQMSSETDCSSTRTTSIACQSDRFVIDDKEHSFANIYLNNSKLKETFIDDVHCKYFQNLPGAMPIDFNRMCQVQNNNSPWLINVIKKKFHRHRSSKSPTIDDEQILDKSINTNGTNAKWIVHETDVFSPLIKTFDQQINASRATASSTDESLHLRHYHYDFQPLITPTVSATALHLDPPIQSSIVDNEEISSLIDRDESNVPIVMEKSSKRAKSASAAPSRPTKKKKSKYYQEKILSPEEIELREALRIIDLDNVGFFPPSELRKVLEEIGISSNDIEKIENCLPLDEDGHYSTDNLIKLFLSSK